MLLSLVAFLSVGGCGDDLRRKGLFREGSGEIMISFSVDKGSTSRSGESGGWESLIDHAYLLFYDANAEVSAMPLAAARAEVNEEVPGSLTLKIPSRLKDNVDYKLIAIANADGYVPDGFETYEDYLNSKFFNLSESVDAVLKLSLDDIIEASGSKLLPMCGVVSDDASFRFTINNGVYRAETSLTFRRNVSRVDLTNNASGFEVEGVALCNWRDEAYIPESGSYTGEVRGVLTSDDENYSCLTFLPFPQADDSGLRKLAGEIYCFPSLTLDPKQGDDSTTALIVKGRYGEDAASSYYRINLGVNGSKAQLKANTKYNVVIQSVKGTGASSALEAYSSNESLVVLSVVEDWDLDGNFAMDDNGNFIILSKGMLEFSSEGPERQEIKVLTSRGLDWDVEYYPLDATDKASADAFQVARIDNTSLSITTKGTNNTKQVFIGYCRVSATTSSGSSLAVDISVIQPTSGEIPFEPELPEGVDVALVPLTEDHVKVNYSLKEIEIDGFAPEIFNSFIDVPFMLYISDNIGKEKEMVVDYGETNKLSWPLEGRISKSPAADYFYCPESFTAQSVYSKSESALKSPSQLSIGELTLQNMESFYISVGTMAPDDPEIVRTIKIKVSGEDAKEEWDYTLKIKPRPAIIDDVIVTDENGASWVIMDRNVQDVNVQNKRGQKVAGRDRDGLKSQPYHYCGWESLKIPGKVMQMDVPISESYHSEYAGRTLTNTNVAGREYIMTNYVNGWLTKYQYKTGQQRMSPFYETDNISNWIFPSRALLELCGAKMKVSKMRMFLVSDVPAFYNDEEIPVCSYIPYLSTTIQDNSTSGYLAMNSTVSEGNVAMIVNPTELNVFSRDPSNAPVVSRLVYPLANAQLENYKNLYLGYGADGKHKLKVCSPDTYNYWTTFTPAN